MANKDKLLSYIEYGSKKGRSQEEITQILKNYNYTEDLITTAFAEYNTPRTNSNLIKYAAVGIILLLGIGLLLLGASFLFLEPNRVTTLAVNELFRTLI